MKYPDWLTKAEVAAKLGVSVKTVERLAATGELQKKSRHRPGGSPVNVFHPEDVERLAAKRREADSRPFVVNQAAADPSGPSQLEQIAQAFADAIMERLKGVQVPQVPTTAAPLALLPGAHLVNTKTAIKMGYPRRWLVEQEKAGTLHRIARKWSVFELERLAGK